MVAMPAEKDIGSTDGKGKLKLVVNKKDSDEQKLGGLDNLLELIEKQQDSVIKHLLTRIYQHRILSLHKVDLYDEGFSVPQKHQLKYIEYREMFGPPYENNSA